MLPHTRFEAVIMLIVFGVVVYFAWYIGKNQNQLVQTLLQQPAPNSPDSDAMGQPPIHGLLPDKYADQQVNPEIDSLKALDKIAELCDKCAHEDNQCTTQCTNQDTIDTCENLTGYANMPRLPCPIDDHGISSYGMFRTDPHFGVGLSGSGFNNF